MKELVDWKEDKIYEKKKKTYGDYFNKASIYRMNIGYPNILCTTYLFIYFKS